jgi:hypothetical protein
MKQLTGGGARDDERYALTFELLGALISMQAPAENVWPYVWYWLDGELGEEKAQPFVKTMWTRKVEAELARKSGAVAGEGAAVRVIKSAKTAPIDDVHGRLKMLRAPFRVQEQPQRRAAARQLQQLAAPTMAVEETQARPGRRAGRFGRLLLGGAALGGGEDSPRPLAGVKGPALPPRKVKTMEQACELAKVEVKTARSGVAGENSFLASNFVVAALQPSKPRQQQRSAAVHRTMQEDMEDKRKALEYVQAIPNKPMTTFEGTHTLADVLHDFKDDDGDAEYLTVTKGQVIWVSKLTKDRSWVFATTRDRSQTGWVPFEFVGAHGYLPGDKSSKAGAEARQAEAAT